VFPADRIYSPSEMGSTPFPGIPCQGVRSATARRRRRSNGQRYFTRQSRTVRRLRHAPLPNPSARNSSSIISQNAASLPDSLSHRT
jgi:hypothetical protein